MDDRRCGGTESSAGEKLVPLAQRLRGFNSHLVYQLILMLGEQTSRVNRQSSAGENRSSFAQEYVGSTPTSSALPIMQIWTYGCCRGTVSSPVKAGASSAEAAWVRLPSLPYCPLCPHGEMVNALSSGGSGFSSFPVQVRVGARHVLVWITIIMTVRPTSLGRTYGRAEER